MISLDNLLHEAECLERGSKGGSVSAIGLHELSKFFDQVSADQPTTLEGRILLAKQGIDSARTEALLKDMQSEIKIEDSLSSVSTQKMRHQKMAPYTAIQRFEMLKHDNNEHQRKQFRDEMLSVFGNKEIPINSISQDYKLFPTDPRQLGKLSEYAQLFAKNQIDQLTKLIISPEDDQVEESAEEMEKDVEPFSTVRIILEQSREAILSSHNIEESTKQIRVDFFTALIFLICREGLPEDLSQAESSPDTLREMICGSLDFLTNQYRICNFSKNNFDTTADEIDKFVMSRYPDVQPPWPHIWVCIRSGLFNLVESFCLSHHKETAEFWYYFDLYILQGEEPTFDVQSNVFINTKPKNEYEAFRTFCYIFVIGEDVQQPPVSYLKIAEDFIFLMLSPHRYSTSSINTDGYSSLNDFQQLVSFEASKIFKDSNDRFVYSMLMALILRFDLCIKSLLENKLFPVEVLHILIALDKSGLWKRNLANSILPNIIGEFINLLPLTMTSQIIDYLSLVNDRKQLIKFLLSLDVNEYSIRLDSPAKQNALQMIQDEIESNMYSINSLHLFVITLEYDNACKLLIAISNDIPSTFSLIDTSEAVLIGAILLNKLKSESAHETTLVNLQNASLSIAIHVLSMSDQLSQSERERLLFNTQQLRIECTSNTFGDELSFLNDSKTTEILSKLSNLLHLLVLFDSGRSDLAAKEVIHVKQIIPFAEQDLEPSLAWIDENPLPSSSLIGATVIRFLSYYMESSHKNKNFISTLFEFCSRLQILSEETNKKLLKLHDSLTRLNNSV